MPLGLVEAVSGNIKALLRHAAAIAIELPPEGATAGFQQGPVPRLTESRLKSGLRQLFVHSHDSLAKMDMLSFDRGPSGML